MASAFSPKAGPRSCDTFVVLPPHTADKCVIFGKNSDRPCAEVQEVIYVPAADHTPGSKVEVDQPARTHAAILSKPSWCWGAEMGANEYGVCIGNEAVWPKTSSEEDLKEKLIGMDLVRLGIERCKTAKEALDEITSMLDKYGQGGPCTEDPDSWAYLNSFMIADQKEAWVLETVGTHWAAEHVTSGHRNISNQLSIRTKIDAMSPGLKEFAQEKGYWKAEDGDFDFAKVFDDAAEALSVGDAPLPRGREEWGKKLLDTASKEGNFQMKNMASILRHEESGICMTGYFVSSGSQISVLSAPDSGAPCCHWFTGTPNPCHSMYKPFIFTDFASIGDGTVSPTYGSDDPAKVKPRFQKQVNRKHRLFEAHQKLSKLLASGDPKGQEALAQMHELESHCVDDMAEIMNKFDDKSKVRVAPIFQHMVELEMNFYKF